MLLLVIFKVSKIFYLLWNAKSGCKAGIETGLCHYCLVIDKSSLPWGGVESITDQSQTNRMIINVNVCDQIQLCNDFSYTF